MNGDKSETQETADRSINSEAGTLRLQCSSVKQRHTTSWCTGYKVT